MTKYEPTIAGHEQRNHSENVLVGFGSDLGVSEDHAVG